MMREAIGYIRVSHERQVNEGVSLDAQRSKIASYCDFAGLRLVECFADEGISGRRANNRPALADALERVCDGQGVLVAYSLSRLARSTQDCLDIMARLRSAGADLVLLDLRVDTTHYMGRFVFTLMAALSELESEQISERIRGCMAYARQQALPTGPPPFGYDIADGVLVVNSHEQATLAYMGTLRAAGWTHHRIAQHLNKRGVPGKRGGGWHKNTVRYILEKRKRYVTLAEKQEKPKIA